VAKNELCSFLLGLRNKHLAYNWFLMQYWFLTQ